MRRRNRCLKETLAPNISSFNASLQTLIGAAQIDQAQADAIVAFGLWQVPTDYSSVYNASINIATDRIILCYAMEFVEAGAAADAYENLWVYLHQRAYGLSFYDFYNLCTFPVGEPEMPYYRCHSGDLYEVFGTYYLFDLPPRVAEDIYYTNAVQDMWASFARTGNPNVDDEYPRRGGIRVRGSFSPIGHRRSMLPGMMTAGGKAISSIRRRFTRRCRTWRIATCWNNACPRLVI